MSTRLKYVDPNRRPGMFSRAYARFSNTRLGRFLSVRGVPMRARVVVDEVERERLWALADRVFAPYAAYRREAAKANRRIPIVQLVPRSG
jgi:hypothetical protein